LGEDRFPPAGGPFQRGLDGGQQSVWHDSFMTPLDLLSSSDMPEGLVGGGGRGAGLWTARASHRRRGVVRTRELSTVGS
jgi:hypothetical protein